MLGIGNTGLRSAEFLLRVALLFGAGVAGAAAQPAPPPPSLASLFSTIQAQESQFPLPQPQATIVIGTIDLSNPGAVATLSYAIPQYQGTTTHPVQIRSQGAGCNLPGRPGPGGRPRNPVSRNVELASNTVIVPVFGAGPCDRGSQAPDIGGKLTVANILHLNLVFAIRGWPAPSVEPSLTIQLGARSQTVPSGSTEVEFDDVTGTSLPLVIAVQGGLTVNGAPVAAQIPGVLPLVIEWKTLAAGAMTIPVLPVSIVYAPLVDKEKKNTASSAKSSTSGNVTTVSFATQNAATSPVPSTFQKTTDLATDMSAAGAVLSKIPNPITTAVGSALTAIASGLGSAVATQTDTLATTTQNALAVTNTYTAVQTALASQGGPGVGDLITYYYDARVLWYSDSGKMRLDYLGSDGWVQATAGELTSVQTRLKASPAGTVDDQTHLDLAGVSALLNLDPFVAGGPGAALPADRFVSVSNGVIEVLGGTFSNTFSHQVQNSDSKTVTKTTLDAQTDKTGFLSFLGLGVTDNKSVQTSVSQSTSVQNSTAQSFTQQFTFNGSPDDYYGGEVYFDVVFGAFAFRSVPAAQTAVAVSGTLADRRGAPVANQPVTVSLASRTFLSATDASGRFAFKLPGADPGRLRVSAKAASASVSYRGAPISGLVLKQR